MNAPVKIRWMLCRDFPECLAIEQASFPCPWTEDELLAYLRHRNAIGQVAEQDGRILGYMICEYHRQHTELVNLAVAPEARRKYVGHRLVWHIQDHAVRTKSRRSRVTLQVCESNLAAQLFFRSMGFRAVATVRKPYERTNEDAYQMEWRADGTETEQITQADLDRLFYGGVA